MTKGQEIRTKVESIWKSLSDEQLMTHIGDGDRSAYEILVNRHLRNYVIFATRIIGDRGAAEDVMQDAFFKLWSNADKWDHEKGARFTTWFYRIVMNSCVDMKRKYRPAAELKEAEKIVSSEPKPDRILSDKQKATIVAEALENLPERQKNAIILCYFHGQGNIQAAEVMGISVGAIESLLVRGRNRLAEILQGQKHEFLKEKI